MKLYAALAALVVALASAAGALATSSGSPYLGVWTARLSRAQMINDGQDTRLAGKLRLVLRANGSYTTFNSFDGSSRGRFVVSRRRIVFTNDLGCKQAGLDGRGAYTWSIARGRLRLSALFVGSDSCGSRWQTLTYPVWTKKT